MDRHVLRRLLPAAIVLVAVIAIATVIVATRGSAPLDEPRVATTAPDALDAAIGKARTFYEFGHYERAMESYADAAALGMTSGEEWYRYAQAAERAGATDGLRYARALSLLRAEDAAHELVPEVEAALARIAVRVDLRRLGTDGEHSPGTVVRLDGIVVQIIPGRVADSRDALYLGTPAVAGSRPSVVVLAPRERAARVGESLAVIGTVEGWCAPGGEIDPYLCVEAVVIRASP